MSLFQDIREIKTEQFAAYVIIFLAVIAPGLLMIYLFEIELFKSLETLKLIIFAMAISLPLPAINTMLSGHIDKEEEPEIHDHVFLNTFISFAGIYLAILSAYIFSLTFKQFLLIIAALEIVYIASLFCERWFGRPNSQSKGAQ